ncbi:ABC transporter permease [Enterococcus sp. DIV0086]|uniref:ABC transporter permease n=1 Tax=Enterococcus sp. DIV0086 TaxID=2774655 RepID=UPI003D270793
MRLCLYQEMYKLLHKKLTYLAPIFIFFVMAIFRIVLDSEDPRLLGMANYAGGQALFLVMIIIGSTIFSMEYQNHAILTILYKTPSKFILYTSKVITLFIYNLFLHVITIIFMGILQSTPLSISVNWLSVYQYNQPLWLNMINQNIIDIITTFLIISLIVLFSCLISNNSAVVTVNIIIVFMGGFISTNLLNNRVLVSPLLKWNPLNMTLLTQQYYNYDMYHDSTLLNNNQIIIGTIVYIFTFLVLGYVIFRKKRY